MADFTKNDQKKELYLYARMKYFRYILCLLLFVFAFNLYGQNEAKKYSKSKRGQTQTLVEQAQVIKEKSPTQAIKLLEQAVLEASKKKDWEEEGKAYLLLGEIYEDVEQKDLAIQRYEQALDILGRSKDRGPTAVIHQRLGQLYLDLNNDKQAEKSFKLCLEFGTKNEIKLKCEEGLADVELSRGNVTASMSQLDTITAKYKIDSMTNARIEARRSVNYAQQKDYTNATESFYNSYNSLPKNEAIKKEDYAPIEKAQNTLLDFNTINNEDKIALQNNVINNPPIAASNTNYLKENLKIVSLYEKDNKFADAEKFIAISKNSINDNSDAAAVADIYKKSAELNLRKGNMAAALADYDQYISAKEMAIDNLRSELNQQIEIVKGQKELDQKKQQFNLEEKERELYESQLNTQKIIIGFLSLLLIASLVYFYFLFKNVKAKRIANQRLLLKSLRTQMNPHFIFNALNSVNNFIAKNDEKAANKFLSEFSRLMRKVLDHSQKDFIAFEEEIELNELYLKLEHFRFRDKFDYEFQNKVKNKSFDLEIPPMLIQPFVENAVWHGLRYKEEKGYLKIQIDEVEKHLVVTIEDNGIGREKSKALKTKNQKKYKSTGLENVSKRIALINNIYQKNYEINVQDSNENSADKGTLVQIKIPVK
ncbi:MAG: histidine kinase [Saprospiraceae bacterium]